jgi:hypothetical protein
MSISMPRQLALSALLALATPCALAQAQLTVSHSHVYVQWAGSAPLGLAQGSLLAEREHGVGSNATTYGRSALGNGRMQAYSRATDRLLVESIAGITLTLENTGTAPLTLAPGDLSARLEVNMIRGTGSLSPAIAQNGVQAILSGLLPNVASGNAARLDYLHSVGNSGPPTVIVNEIETGGFQVVPALDPFGLFVGASLSAPGFTVAVGESFQIQATLETWVVAGANFTTAWFAETDGYFAGNGLELHLNLPAGVNVSSPVPLSWVAPAVPEPAAAWLLIGGLPLLLRAARRGRRGFS